MLNRRGFIAALMAGGVIVAGELWIPGQKLISIPSGKVFGNEYGINATFRMIDKHTIQYIGDEDKVVSIREFHDWLKKFASHMLRHDQSSMVVSLDSGYRLTNPEHLTEGSFTQDAPDQHMTHDLREMWTSTESGETELITDKLYFNEQRPLLTMTPRERITVSDTGHRGYR